MTQQDYINAYNELGEIIKNGIFHPHTDNEAIYNHVTDLLNICKQGHAKGYTH